MISYEGIQDIVTAILVILVVSLVVAAAWLSTNVREQPLVATAVVVFQSGHAVETERTHSDSGQSPTETQSSNNSVIEGEASGLRATSQMKESEDTDVTKEQDMEVPQRTGRELAGGSQSSETCNISLSLPKEVSEKSVQRSENLNVGSTSLVSESDQDGVVQNLSQEPNLSESNVTNQSTDSSIPSHASSLEKLRDIVPDVEVRNRRLQQFISMGESSTCSEAHSSTGTTISSELLEVKDLHTSAEDKLCKSSDGASLDETCSHSIKTEENITTLSSESSASIKEEEIRPPGSIRIRLKFLDETQRYVFAKLTEQVGTFKRQHFSIEMDANRRIRLIFNGQLLSQDTSTLAQYGLFENCVVHCHVSQPQHTSRSSGQSGGLAAQDEDDAYVSGLLVNDFALVLHLII
ncbi:transmembrane and ubiquitin-like domain-containing protein 1 isoform X2 [Procambarus clarkii]|uniref:transmembrane and ubiquitin-like domain-containing protein 1 isoform X2 n=1 Tax=Procambarus clarkii TaxID=6728 RepID=UPI001E671F45|nr:transmembrane and ubiquitin-like domain-containing protein 1 isoform X2 [Procambarus clarkii]